jgi:two-component system response regulator AtoC
MRSRGSVLTSVLPRIHRKQDFSPMGHAAPLLITADPSLVEVVQGLTESLGLGLWTVPTIDEACSRLQQHEVALLLPHLTRARGPADVGRLLATVVASRKPVAAVVISDRSQLEHAPALLRQGAADYLERPLEVERLAWLIDKLTARARYEPNQARLAPKALAPTTLTELDRSLGRYSPLNGIREQIERVAPLDTTLLLTGETGSGKTQLARTIHQLSPRCRQPFLVVQCGALSATLIESELFGHVEGSFTGAHCDRAGKLAAVGRGTLLLDDIDALPMEIQVKLLRVVEERVFEPVGSDRSLPLQARLIAASNRPLKQEAAAGRFRTDLYYRLNVVQFHLSPLREQRQAIPVLARQFLAEFGARMNRGVFRIDLAALRALIEYDWPGNIRELRNVMERAVALSSGPEIRLEAFSGALPASSDGPPLPPPEGLPGQAQSSDARTLKNAKDSVEISRILDALRKHQNNLARAAAELGISRVTLYSKLRRHGLGAYKGNGILPA